MKELGYHAGYRYAHDEPGAFAAGEDYLPEGLEDMRWYAPTERGLEARIREKLAALQKLNDDARAAGRDAARPRRADGALRPDGGRAPSETRGRCRPTVPWVPPVGSPP